MDCFRGGYERELDGKNRLWFPEEFAGLLRRYSDGRVSMQRRIRNHMKFLTMYPFMEGDTMENYDHVGQLEKSGSEVRIVIPKPLVHYAGMKTNILLTGWHKPKPIGSINIYPKESYQERVNRLTDHDIKRLTALGFYVNPLRPMALEEGDIERLGRHGIMDVNLSHNYLRKLREQPVALSIVRELGAGLDEDGIKELLTKDLADFLPASSTRLRVLK